MTSTAKKQAIARYDKKAYEQIKFRSRRENRLSDLLKVAAFKHNISVAAYITRAIYAQLDIDGISLQSLEQLDQGTERANNPANQPEK